jgi:hypothetical protein
LAIEASTCFFGAFVPLIEAQTKKIFPVSQLRLWPSRSY